MALAIRRRRVGRSVWGLLLLLCISAVGCDDRLPGFADPPAYDAGDAGEERDGGSDDDAG